MYIHLRSMYAMPRNNKTFRTTAKALLAIPSMSGGARTPSRAGSPFRTSVSMTLPESPHAILAPSCHSSPGNGHDDRSILDFEPLPTTAPARPPRPLPLPLVALDREDWKHLLKTKQRYAMLRRTISFLHDNRALSSKHPDTARRLRQLNAELRADKDCRVLKFILNAIFISIGLLLLLSVLAAIGYTSTG